MANVGILGYGKMGREIEKIAQQRGHKINARFTSADADQITVSHLSTLRLDVVIEFTHPTAGFNNIKTCLEAGIPVVSGTTGWLDRWSEIERIVEERNGTLLYASNFSLGMNIFFKLNSSLGKIMADYQEYVPSIREVHHTAKKDAPSGTAITLAEKVLSYRTDKAGWSLSEEETDKLHIMSVREDPAPGTHTVRYTSAIDDIEITHTAKSRTGFALGAVLAAEYATEHKGILTMADVLNLS